VLSLFGEAYNQAGDFVDDLAPSEAPLLGSAAPAPALGHLADSVAEVQAKRAANAMASGMQPAEYVAVSSLFLP
jgi:hypothetical protein